MSYRSASIALASALVLAGMQPLLAGPAMRAPVEAPSLVITVQSCQQIAQQIAAEQGGEVSSAREQTRDGQRVCVIVVEGKGKRAQRMTVPLN